MRGKRCAKPRVIEPDYKYNNVSVGKFVNYLIIDGKKSIATRVAYDALEIIADKLKSEPVFVFETAIKNTSPVLEVKGRRIGGANYQIPFEVPKIRRQTLAMKWMINSARAKQGKPMKEFLADEIIDAYNNQGSAIKKKDEMHRMAEANKAFAHFAKFI